MMMALWGGLFGIERLFDVLSFLLALAIVFFALVLQRHAGGAPGRLRQREGRVTP